VLARALVAGRASFPRRATSALDNLSQAVLKDYAARCDAGRDRAPAGTVRDADRIVVLDRDASSSKAA
jgi:hypothetical protein